MSEIWIICYYDKPILTLKYRIIYLRRYGMSSGFVVLMGIGTVFFGLICIILVCTLMSAVIKAFQKKPSSAPITDNKQVSAPAQQVPSIPSRPELAAAIAAAIAEYSGKDISGIRILSIKKL